MSLLESFVGHAAGAGADIIGTKIRDDLAMERERTIQSMREAAGIRAEDRAQERVDQQRTQKLARTESALGDENTGMIGSYLGNKYGKPVMGDTPMTPEQQAVFDQGMEQQGKDKKVDAEAIRNDPNARLQAQVMTGDTDPSVVANMNSKADAAAARLDNQMQIAQLRNEATNARTDAQREVGLAKLESAIAKAGNGNTDFDKKIKLLKEAGATPKELANFITEKKQPSLEDLATGFLRSDPNAGYKNAMTPAQAYEKAKKVRELTSTFGDDAPAPAKPTAAPGLPAPAKPSAAPVPSLPAGAKQIGTSGGKPVYETPDGKRFIQK